MKRVILAAVLVLACLTVIYGDAVTRRERVYRRLVVQGDYAIARGNSFEAVAAFTEAIELKPDSMLGYLKRGEAHRRRGDLALAAADLEQAAALDPTAPRVLELSGDVEAARQHHDRAAEHYAASVKLDDRSPRVLYKLALSWHLGGSPARATEVLARAVALDGRFAEAHYLLGVCLRGINKPREAEQSLKRAIAFAPTLLAAREELAELYGALGRRGDRIAELERLLSADASPGRQVTLAVAHANAGQTARALRQLRHATEIYPDHAGPYLALGRIWLDLAEAENDRVAFGKAIEALQHAVSMEPSGVALARLGTAQLSSGNLTLAERTLRLATEQLPAEPTAFLHLADAAQRAGHKQVARRALLDYHSLSDPPNARERALSER
ncbi:MAG: tetratricopeptide repeat protein, partial [Vicinamibacterales bacterium]